jgi:hypothetical protein
MVGSGSHDLTGLLSFRISKWWNSRPLLCGDDLDCRGVLSGHSSDLRRYGCELRRGVEGNGYGVQTIFLLSELAAVGFRWGSPHWV